MALVAVEVLNASVDKRSASSDEIVVLNPNELRVSVNLNWILMNFTIKYFLVVYLKCCICC